MKTGEYIIESKGNKQKVKLQFTSQILKFTKQCSGIGEHSDITEAVIEELDKLASAQDRLDMIEKHFGRNKQHTLFT